MTFLLEGRKWDTDEHTHWVAEQYKELNNLSITGV